MVGNLLMIKTSIPPQGANILPRPGVMKSLDEGLFAPEGFAYPLTLVSAPAGFGKTTVIRSWLAGREDRVAWFALDEEDNEAERFWLYLLSALQLCQPDLAHGPMEMLRSGTLSAHRTDDVQTLLITLLNDLFCLGKPCYLVLDDYHVINNVEIHKDMAYFLENLPPTLHLVVTTRSDPPWPLFRWRAKGRLAEFRLDRLRFSEEETVKLFSETKGLRLSESQLSTLHHKTEGWIAGLQLAAYSLTSVGDPDTFIQEFAGSQRHVFHFLSEEVLAGQPDPLRDFLLKTSILNRFSVPLCNAVTGREDSALMLEALERDNLFVIPLDSCGEWYRYHHLFSDLLHHQIRNRQPDIINDLHDRAGRWFLEANELSEAVHHFYAGQNLEQVAVILHNNSKEIVQSQGPSLMIRCLESFPDALLRKYPLLAIHKALFYLFRKGREEAGDLILLAEDSVDDDVKSRQEYAGIFAVVRAYYNLSAHDIPGALKYAAEALQLLPADDYYWRMNIAVISGDIRLFSGNPKGAYPFYYAAHQSTVRLNKDYFSLSTAFKLATSLYRLGRMDETEELIRNMLKTAGEKGLSRMPHIGGLWALQGELLRERGSLDEAERCVERGLLFSEVQRPLLGWNYLYKVALLFSQQEYNEAIQCISEIDSINRGTQLPLMIMYAAAAWQAQIMTVQNEPAKAKEVLSQVGIRDDLPVCGGQEQGFLVLSRILLMENRDEAARIILKQTEELALSGEDKKTYLESLLLNAWLEERAGNDKEAEKCLYTALEAGRECGFFQLFSDTGKEYAPIILRLLEQCNSSTGTAPEDELLQYARRICRAVLPDSTQQRTVDIPGKTAQFPDLAEELSSRELEVLDLIGRGLSNQDVSEKLFLSLGTVKWHTSNIYGKLGVRGRTQAVALARKLKLIP